MIGIVDGKNALRRRNRIPAVELDILLIGIEARKIELHAAIGEGELGADLIGFGDFRTILSRKYLRLGIESAAPKARSEEHTSELQSLMRISYAVFCLKKKNKQKKTTSTTMHN